jgi:hypothetical protein
MATINLPADEGWVPAQGMSFAVGPGSFVLLAEAASDVNGVAMMPIRPPKRRSSFEFKEDRDR